MKKFRFCALCLILAALLSACGRQAAQDVPGAAAVPSPAAVPEAPVESTSTLSPTAPAEIGKEFDDLSFLNEEQRQAYEGAYKLNYTLYGLPDNLVGVDVSPRFTQQSDNEGVFVLTVGNYALYENPYTDFTNLMQSVFTTDFIRRLGPLYTEKFIDLDGHLATSCDSVLACPMHDDLSRTVMDNCPDTYRLESVTDDTVVFALISHYDRNWASSFAPDDMDVYTIEYPIRLVRTANPAPTAAAPAPPRRIRNRWNGIHLPASHPQVPVPEFLTAEQQMVYQRAYKMMLVRAGTYLIDDTQYFPCESPDTGRTQTDTVTVDGYDYTPALNRYRNWDMFYAALRDIFTRDFLDDSYLASDGYCLFRPIDGRMYYLPTERGFAAGYNQVTTTMTFTKLEETDEKIVIRVTAVYATDDTGSQAFRQAVQDGLVSDTSTYTITMVREVGGWRFAQFEVPF